MFMSGDEQAIRQLVKTWMDATRAGEIDTILSLMSDDAIFLRAGQPVMHKPDFEIVARAQSSGEAPKFDGTSDIQEIKVMGDWAFMWSKLTVVAASPADHSKHTRAGYTLTVFNRQNGKWVLARDANMLAPVSDNDKS
jgi:uncharacterized protein (TIGR02246 family)